MSALSGYPFPLACRASRIGFFVAGFGLAVWAPLVPFVRERIPMNDATFGLMLLCVGVGSLSCMPLSGQLAARLGIRKVALCCIAFLLTALFGIASTTSLWLLGIALFVFGASLGVLDVVLNIHSLLLEKASNRRLMANFHGMFSIGTLAGALTLTSLLSLGVSSLSASFVMISLMLVLSCVMSNGLLSQRTSSGSRSTVRPTSTVLAVGLMCFVVYLAEGAILDWSALYLTQYKDMTTAHAGLGYTCFALMVALARLGGDKIALRIGNQRLIIGGSAIACAGILLSICSPLWPLTLLGYALCGLGCANISPVLISSLNKQQQMPASDAVTAATTIGFAGVLVGPALMGAIAHYSNLSWAFAALAALLAALMLCSRRLPH